LLLGSATEPKETVEFVVFENHIAREGSTWRMTDKIYPHFSEKKDGINRPTLLKKFDKEQLPEATVPILQGWDGKVKRDEELHKESELDTKGDTKKSA
jgi:hypothetical protein